MVRGLGLLVRAGLLGWALALAAGCVDDAEARRGRWRAEARPPAAASPDAGVADSGTVDSGPADTGTDIFERYEWDVSYSTHQIDLVANNWPSEQGVAARLLSAAGVDATTGKSTTGLTAAGIGAARVDQGASATTGTNGYFVASGWVIGDSRCQWTRYLVRRDGDAIATTYIDRYLASTSNTGWRVTGTTGTARLKELAGPGGAQFNPAYTLPDASWRLIDVIMDADGGTGPVARRTLMDNGTETVTDHTDDPELAALTGGYGVLGSYNGTMSPGANVTLLFVGHRFGCANMISLAQHRIDAEDVGLYTP